MPAYIIAQLKIDDYDTFARYGELTMPTLAAHAGALCAADDAAETLEGEDDASRTVILRFESKDAARSWFESESYQEAAAVRRSCASGDFVLVEGLA